MTDTLIAAEVFPPGEYLRDELDERGWTISEFAEVLGRPTQAVSEILNGRKEITPETATEIGRALGTSAEVWLNLQNTYRLRHLKAEPSRLESVDRRARLRSLVPLAEIRRLGWIPDGPDLTGTERAVCDLLGITDLRATPSFAAAARRSDQGIPLSPSQIAWLGRVRQLGSEERVRRLDLQQATRIGSELAGRLRDPHAFGGAHRWLSDAGVALVIVPALKGSKIDGAVLRLATGSPVIGLSLRGNRFDSAVFTLAHELAHLALGHVDGHNALLDEALGDDGSEGIEAEADRLASSWLFPVEPVVPRPISGAAVRAAAAGIGCHPALVVGRLQWQGRLPWTHLRGLIPRMSELVPSN